MKNKYIVENNVIKIFLPRRNNKASIETLIDAEDFDKINKYAGTFVSGYNRQKEEIYAQICLYLGTIDGSPKYKILRMHRIIMNCNSRHLHVDHKNRNSLDNRKSNLRIVSNADNLKNRESKNSNNKTGYRNVCFYKGLYLVQLQVGGKNKLLGRFKNVNKANIFAKEMRKKYYKEFKGKTT